MEIDELQLSNYVRMYENFLPIDIHNKFLKYCCDLKEFEPGKIIAQVEINKAVRNVGISGLNNNPTEKSWTKIHWANFMVKFLADKIENYFDGYREFVRCTLNHMQILKYEEGGHYRLHSDHAETIPRTLSFIYIINDDYEGGDLVFVTPRGTKECKMLKKKNSLIIWPSNFLFPHMVTPVTKGVRYSMVAWAI